MPIIPLVGTAAAPMASPVRQKISKDSIQEIAGLVMKRIDAVKGPLLEGAPAAGILKLVVGAICALGKGKVASALTSGLCPNVEGQQPLDYDTSAS
jgi:hypothetical protein